MMDELTDVKNRYTNVTGGKSTKLEMQELTDNIYK